MPLRSHNTGMNKNWYSSKYGNGIGSPFTRYSSNIDNNWNTYGRNSANIRKRSKFCLGFTLYPLCNEEYRTQNIVLKNNLKDREQGDFESSHFCGPSTANNSEQIRKKKKKKRQKYNGDDNYKLFKNET